MLRLKSYTIIGLALVLMFCLGWYLASRQSQVPGEKAETRLESEEVQSLKEKVSHLEEELRQQGAQLENAHQALDERLQFSMENPSQPKESADRELKEEPVDLNRMEKTSKTRMEEVIEKSKAAEGYDFRKQQMASYEAEAVDEQWARPRERAIEDTFATEEALQGAVLKSVDCRSKRCRIEVYYQSEREVSQLSRELNQVILESDDALFVPQVFVSYSEDGEVASLFLGDDVDTPLY